MKPHIVLPMCVEKLKFWKNSYYQLDYLVILSY